MSEAKKKIHNIFNAFEIVNTFFYETQEKCSVAIKLDAKELLACWSYFFIKGFNDLGFLRKIDKFKQIVLVQYASRS